MSDLISKQAVMEALEKVFDEYSMAWKPNEKYGGFAKAVPDVIKSIPIAYDVDKVVEQLEGYPHGEYKDDYGAGFSTALNLAIEIVKKGGINEKD